MRHARNTRTVLSIAANPSERIAVSGDHLYLSVDALHWEQRKAATAAEKTLYDVKESYSGNDNGDFFEGARNVVWACKSPACRNADSKKRFLKYPEKDCCPHCGSKNVYDWEFERFGTVGELLDKHADGRYKFQTWGGEPVNINHDSKQRIGKIMDVWIEPNKNSVVELLAIERKGEFGNDSLCHRISQKLVDSGSMELLTGHGMCSICFNEHSGEEEFCEHLKNNKGGIDQRTGMRVFEICKDLTGCGHAIIATGDPADSNARVRQLIASKDSTMEEPASDPNVRYDTALAKPKTEVVRRASRPGRAEDTPEVNSVGDPNRKAGVAKRGGDDVPKFDQLSEQLKVFGNYDSTRSPEQLRVAKMSPKEREEWEAFQEFKKTGRTAQIAVSTLPHLDKEFLAGVLRDFGAETGAASSSIRKAVDYAVNHRSAVSKFIKEKFGKVSGARKRLASKKSAGMLSEKDLLTYALADYLEKALELAKQIRGTISPDELNTAFENTSLELSSMGDDFESFLEEENLGLDEDDNLAALELEMSGMDADAGEDDSPEPTVIHQDEPETEQFASGEESEEERKKDKPMNRNAQSTDTSDPNKLESSIPSQKPTTPKTETFPDSTLVKAMKTRKAAIEQRMADGEGDFDTLLAEHSKITAQLQVATEKFPKSDDLGGSVSENPKPPKIPAAKETSPKPEFAPESSEDLGGDGIQENPKPPTIKQAASDESSTISQLKEMGIWPKDEKAAQVETNADTETFPDDSTEGVDVENPDKSTKPTSAKTEEFPASSTQVKCAQKEIEIRYQIKGDAWKRKTFPSQAVYEKWYDAQVEKYGEGVIEVQFSREGQTQMSLVDKEDVKNKNQGVATPVDGAETPNSDDPTPIGKADKEMIENSNLTGPTPKGGAETPSGKTEGGDELNKPDPAAEKEMIENAGNHELTKMGQEIDDREITAQFIENNEPGKRASSYWLIRGDRDLPLLRVSAKTAFPNNVIKNYPSFASEEYGQTLAQRVASVGAKAVNAEFFDNEAQVFGTLAERQAEFKRLAQISDPGLPAPATPTASNVGGPAMPAAQQGAPQTTADPMNVDPAVSDRIMGDDKPGISVVDLVASMFAPIVAESQTLSTTTLVEELINLTGDQDKVTELTTKLNDKIQEIKADAGMPEDASAGQAPDAGAGVPPPMQPIPGAEAAPQNNTPTVVQAGKKELEYNRKLQAMRITPLVDDEIKLGITPGYRAFLANNRMSRKAAKEAAAKARDKRIAELSKLPEEAFLILESTVRKAIRTLESSLPKSERDVQQHKRNRFAEMKRDAGGSMVSGIPQDSVIADSVIPSAKERIAKTVKFRLAGGIDPEKMKAELEARDKRDGRDPNNLD